MTKVETEEYNSCSEYPHYFSSSFWSKAYFKCSKAPNRTIENIIGDIPDWCPLEDKKEEK